MIFVRHMRRHAVKLEGEKSSALDLARGRLVLMSVCFVLAYAVLAVRAFDLSVVRAIDIDAEPHTQALETVSAEEARNNRRGNLYDRNGVLLATTLKISSLYADPYLISDIDAAAKGLAKIFPKLSYASILKKLQSESRFEWIARKITPEQQHQVLLLGEPGLAFKDSYRRYYPQGDLLTHTLGFTNVDTLGLAGVERGLNKTLAQETDLTLTLDVRLQHVLKREVAAAVEEFQAKGAGGVILDAHNGEVLASVSLPDFDPHTPPGKDNEHLKFNYVTQGDYELGSVFKIFSTAAFFETNDVPINIKFDAREPLKADGHTIRDYHAEERILTAPEVFMVSSNIGSALMAEAIGEQRLKDFYADLGLLNTLDFEVREVARMRTPAKWSKSQLYTASYGHGVQTTPLQLASGVATIVNGGYRIQPTLVKSGEQENYITERIVSEKTAHRMRQFLRLVVTDGTGRKADVPGYRVGGKTGTAEKVINGRYSDDKKISSFVGAFPMDDPRYVIYIMVDEPVGHKGTWNYATGGWVAAPATKRVISSMVNILGIPPVTEDAPENNFGAGLKQYVSTKEKR